MPQIVGKVNRGLPSAIVEGTPATARLGRYGETVIIPISQGLYGIADEGQYFKATNPTPGTGIAMSITTAFADTAALAVLFNGESSGGKRLFLDYIKLICTVAGATTSASDLAVKIDSGNRYSSGGSAITPVNANMDVSNVASGVLHFGTVVATAASAARIVSRDRLKTQAAPCWTAGDEVIINPGADMSAGPTSGSTPIMIGVPTGPIIIGPQQSLLVHMWNTANATTAPSWEFELGWWER